MKITDSNAVSPKMYDKESKLLENENKILKESSISESSACLKNKDVEKCKANSDNKKIPALDGGWAWAVIIGIFINFLIIQFLGPSYGLLFHDLLKNTLKASSSVIHWIFAMQMFIWHVMVLVNGTLIQEFGWRIIGIVGSLFLAIAFVSSSFASSPVYLFFSYSLLTGIGGSMIMTASYYILPIYWDKKRGMATAIAMSGVCIGQFIAPILINFLLDGLGFKGCALVIGAIVLNGIPASSPFHPISWHVKGEGSDDKVSELKKVSNDSVKSFLQRIGTTTLKHISILKKPQASLIALTSSICLISIFNFQMNIPYSMTHDGFLFSEAAYGRTIISAASAVGRISAAFMSDYSWFRKPYGFLMGIVLTNITIIGFTFCKSLVSIYTILSIHGIGMGLMMGLYSLVIIDFMGLAEYPPTFGSACLLKALFSITIGPLSGLVRDQTDSYRNSIGLLAGFQVIGLVLWIFLISRYKIKSTNKGA